MSPRVKQFLLVALFFGLFTCAFWFFIMRLPIVSSITIGLISGLLFGSAITAFVSSPYIRQATHLDFEQPEYSIFDGPANHFQGFEAVGGWLFLTNQQLVFKSHGLNVQNHKWSILRQDIAAVQRVRSLGIVPNGLQITSKAGQSERFVVQSRDTWIHHLTTL